MKTFALTLFALLFLVPSASVLALTTLNPGGSAVNPIYVQDVTRPQLQMPTQTGMTYEEYLRRLRPAANQQQSQTNNAAPPPLNEADRCKASYGPYSYSPPDKIGCSCLPGYQFGPGLLCVPISVSKPVPLSAPAPTPSSESKSQQSCLDAFGAGSVWNGQTNAQGGPICDCSIGFKWDTSGKFCIVAAVKTGGGGGAVTKTIEPPNTVTAPVVQKTQTCATGQQRRPDGSCVSFQSACVMDFGTHSVWTGETNSTGGAICGCEQWYSYSSDEKQCVPVEIENTAAVADASVPEAGSWWKRFLHWLGFF